LGGINILNFTIYVILEYLKKEDVQNYFNHQLSFEEKNIPSYNPSAVKDSRKKLSGLYEVVLKLISSLFENAYNNWSTSRNDQKKYLEVGIMYLF
jgi:hypothetical protein